MWIGAIMAWDLALSTEDRLSGLFDVFAPADQLADRLRAVFPAIPEQS